MQTNQLITNLSDLYKPALNVGQIQFYSKFLYKFTDNQLDELWDITMETHCRTSPPTIGELKKYANGVTKVKVVVEKTELLTDEDIFSTRLGGFSLQQGWSHSYSVICQEEGIPPQDDETILEFQKAAHRASQAERYLSGKDDIFSKVLLALRETMKGRSECLKEEFKHLMPKTRQLTQN